MKHKFNENCLPMCEYLLWNNCNNSCKFCNLRNEYQSNEQDKILVCELVKEDIKKQKERFNILLVGGEIFTGNTKKVEDSLYELYKVIVKCEMIDQIYINTNILYNCTEFLFKVLDLIEYHDKIDKVHFTTSDDVDGRFCLITKNLFYENLKSIRRRYPTMRIIVNTIITKRLVEMIKNKEYNVKYYQQKYKVEVNNIPYINVKPEVKLCPTKEEFLSTLFLLEKQESGYIKKYCDNLLLNQKFILKQYNPNTRKIRVVTSGYNECGHGENFSKCFVDKDNKPINECLLCLLEILKNSVDFKKK